MDRECSNTAHQGQQKVKWLRSFPVKWKSGTLGYQLDLRYSQAIYNRSDY